MSAQEQEGDLTPPILRKWADRYRDMAAGMKWQTRTDPVEDVVQLYATVAVLLDREAARMEQGERVCRWGAWLQVKQGNGYDYSGNDTGCGGFVYSVVSEPPPRYCKHCGGRVVLGDEEGGDE